MTHLSASELYFKSGPERLFFRTWEAPASRATVVLVHGIGEHSGRHAGLAEALRAAGFSTAAYDLRGHGRSTGKRGHVERFDDHVEDLAVFWRVVADQGRPGPRFVFGHSLGGLVVARWLQGGRAAEAAGAVLASPALGLRIEPRPRALAVARLLERLAPALGLPNGIQPSHLSRDRHVVEEYVRDPLVHRRVTPRAFLEILRAMEVASREASRITTPLLVLGGMEDAVVSQPAMRGFVEGVGSAERRLLLYSRLYHEVFHEPERAHVVGDTIRWLEARLQAGGAVPSA